MVAEGEVAFDDLPEEGQFLHFLLYLLGEAFEMNLDELLELVFLVKHLVKGAVSVLSLQSRPPPQPARLVFGASPHHLIQDESAFYFIDGVSGAGYLVLGLYCFMCLNFVTEFILEVG